MPRCCSIGRCPRGLFRALIYLPVVVSGVAAGINFLRLFDPLLGVLNQILASVSPPTVNWQGNGVAALVSVIVVTSWQGVGFGMVVYLAGLQGIPRQLYEAAVDGATGVKSFTKITWPLLGPTTFFLVVYSIIISFHVFDVVYVLTRGGPGRRRPFSCSTPTTKVSTAVGRATPRRSVSCCV